MLLKTNKSTFIEKITVVIMILLFSACQDNTENITYSDPDEIKNPSVNVKKDNIQDYFSSKIAKNLAINMSNIKVREFIKQEAIKQFDGDYNFLVETNVDKDIETNVDNSNARVNSVKFGNIIAGDLSHISSRTTFSISNFLDSLSLLYPLMQVAVPQLESTDAEMWDEISEIPLVAFIPSDYDESNENQVILAYDSEGNSVELDGSVEPNELVVVISQNERVVALDGEIIGQARTNRCPEIPLEVSPNYDFYSVRSCGGGDYPPPPPPPPPPPTPTANSCDRYRNNGRDVLLKARFRSISQMRMLETWLQGKPEMYVLIVFSNRSSNGNVVGEIMRHNIGNEGWYHRRGIFRRLVLDTKYIHQPLIRWYMDRYGDQMKYIWMEEDRGTLLSASFAAHAVITLLNRQVVSIPISATASIGIGNGDETAGSTYVEYCDNTDGDGTNYVTGGLEFWINQ